MYKRKKKLEDFPLGNEKYQYSCWLSISFSQAVEEKKVGRAIKTQHFPNELSYLVNFVAFTLKLSHLG